MKGWRLPAMLAAQEAADMVRLAYTAAFTQNETDRMSGITHRENRPWTDKFRSLLLAALNEAKGGASCERNDNWFTDRPLDARRGVTTDDNGRITELDLDFNGLSGPLPPQLGNLANMEAMSLGGNELSGCSPAGLMEIRTNALGDPGLSTRGG